VPALRFATTGMRAGVVVLSYNGERQRHRPERGPASPGTAAVLWHGRPGAERGPEYTLSLRPPLCAPRQPPVTFYKLCMGLRGSKGGGGELWAE